MSAVTTSHRHYLSQQAKPLSSTQVNAGQIALFCFFIVIKLTLQSLVHFVLFFGFTSGTAIPDSLEDVTAP
jgi:hypothetical protein